MVEAQKANQNAHGQNNDPNKRNQPNPAAHYFRFPAIRHRAFRASGFSDSGCGNGMRGCAFCPRRTLNGADVIPTHLISRQAALLTALLLFIVVLAVGATPRTRMTISSYCSIVAVV